MSLNPITRKEIFMAKAAGEKVPDITPVTREEIFLSRIAGGGGSGGGGGADILNADGVIKQEHLPEGYPYETIQSETIVSSGLEYTFAEDIGAFVSTGETVQPTIGEEYTVMWNGTRYSCIAVANEGLGAVFGNIGAMSGGDDTGEPFIVAISTPSMIEENGFTIVAIPLDGSEIFTLEITGDVKTVKNIDTKYLPTVFEDEKNVLDLAKKGMGTITIDSGNGQNIEIYDDVSTIKEKLRNGTINLRFRISGPKAGFDSTMGNPYEDFEIECVARVTEIRRTVMGSFAGCCAHAFFDGTLFFIVFDFRENYILIYAYARSIGTILPG